MRRSLNQALPGLRAHISNGMTVIEVLMALSMLVIFGSSLVASLEFISRFFIQHNSAAPSSQGLLVDQYELQVSMDKIVEILSQPGFSYSEIIRLEKKGCTYDPTAGSSSSDEGGWGLPGAKLTSSQYYKFCLSSTPLAESSTDSLISSPDSRPGIYVLRAIPDSISIAALPMRRLFCRPRPYC